MDDVEVPQYFICPISLQIFKDPVTIETGITYDRESIQKWLSSEKNMICPVTKQPLSKDPELTPNHTLQRLIQAWCTAHASNGFDRIPTPKSPVNKTHILKLLQDLCVHPQLPLKSLKSLEKLATESERNRKCLIEAGAAKAMVSVIIKCFRKDDTKGLEETLSVLLLIKIPAGGTDILTIENYAFFDSIAWVLQREMDNHVLVKTHAITIMESIIEVANSSIIQGLKPELFKAILKAIIKDHISRQVTKVALNVLLRTCPYGRNKIKIIEAGAVFDLIELELNSPDKRTTELIMGILEQLCSCPDGRAKFLVHAASIAMVSKRIIMVSPVVDDLAVRILALICKFSATKEVLREMLRVGAVTKLSMVLQAQTSANVKEKAREVLRLHSNVWSNAPCIQVYLLTKYAR